MRTVIFLLLALHVSGQVSFEGGFYIQEGGTYLPDEEAYIPPPKYFTPEEVEATLSSIPLLGNINATQELDNVIILPPPQPINHEGSAIINVDNPICQILNCQLCIQAGCTGSTTPPPPTTTPPPPPPTTTPPPPPPPIDGTSTIIPPEKIGSCTTFAQKALDAHNAARARYGAAPLLWSRTLANFAQSVSDTCVFRHSNGPYGENLAIGTSMTCLRATQLWIEEESKWTYGSSFSSATGHFTQVVWKNTRQVGCAVRNCSGRSFVTCSYYPAGNVIGQFNTNVGPRKSTSG